MLGNHFGCDRSLLQGIKPVETEENHPGVSSTLAKHQLPKVLVRRDQQSLFLGGMLKDIVVGDSRSHLCNVRDLMATRAKRLDNLTLRSLVTYELQMEYLDPPWGTFGRSLGNCRPRFGPERVFGQPTPASIDPFLIPDLLSQVLVEDL